MTTEFKLGDIVELGGLEGEVVDDKYHGLYQILVKLPSGSHRCFTRDGRLEDSHTKPLLNLIKRPKKTKTVRVWQFLRIDGSITSFFYSEDLKNYWNGERMVASGINKGWCVWTITNNYADVEVEV